MTRFLTRNLGWKITSLAAAFLLWLSFSGARELTMSISVPVQYRNIPKDLEISSDIAETVHLVLRGPSPLLSRLNGASLPAVIDLGDVRAPGRRTVTLDRRNFSLPASVVLERAVPGQVQLRMEKRLVREVPVQARFEGLPDGTEVRSVEVIPAKLTIAGPQSRADAIERVETDPIDVSALEGKGEVKVTAISGNPQVNFTTSPIVTVRFQLTTKDSGEVHKK